MTTHAAVRELTEAEAEIYVADVCFKTGPPSRVGVELEWIVNDLKDPGRPADSGRLAAALAGLGPLPGGSYLTHEPGGQLELSSLPADSLAHCDVTVRADLRMLGDALADHGLGLTGSGTDPLRPPRRLLGLPRYAAMEEYFDRAGRWGRLMMCSTASTQICLDAGTDSTGPDGLAARWELAHLLGPVLVATFANSPLLRGRPTGWKSTRQHIWAGIDPLRTRAPRGADPREAWTRYALDAPLLCIRRPDGPWTAPRGLSFRNWIRSGFGPTLDDLRYHLTTLFPPVRPQGHLELRMIDAQPGDGWRVPLALVTALLDDPYAAELAREAVEPLLDRPGSAEPYGELWMLAARDGLADPGLRRAALRCFAAADSALPRLGAPAELRLAVAEHAEHYAARGRTPADARLDALAGKENTRW